MPDMDITVEKQIASTRQREKHRLLAFVLFPPILLMVCFAGIKFVSKLESNSHKQTAEQLLKTMRERGDNAIEFYNTSGTDEILGQMQGAQDIHNLTFTLADLSETGLGIVASLPNLQRLELYGGSGVTDGQFKQLRGKSGLKELVLKNTLVTNDGLALLKEFPDLEKLTIFQEGWRRKDISDAGLVHLTNLSKLKVLRISGGWASGGAIKALRAKLPNCRIVEGEVF